MWPVQIGKLCRPADLQTSPAVLYGVVLTGVIVIGATFCFVLWRPVELGEEEEEGEAQVCHGRTK